MSLRPTPSSVHPRVLVIGLDCAAPELLFDAWRDQLPTLNRLMAQGSYARLESCIPAITIPAWTCMMSSRDPGQLGMYGFRNRSAYDYGPLTVATSRAVQAPRLWDILSQAGRRVGVIGVPQTYPVTPVNGEMVGCFLTPSARSAFTYPAALKAEIAAWLGGDLLMDVPNFRSADQQAVLESIYHMARQRFDICRHLLTRQVYDFFMLVDMGIDRMHHRFWKAMDPRHPGYHPGSPFADAIRHYYRFVDQQIATLLDLVGPETIVMVVSDHGGKPMLGGVCLNEWLIQEGYLVVHDYPAEPSPLDRCAIDWSRTRAWGAGGYYGRVFLNVQGREPAGIIPAAAYEHVRSEIAAKLAILPDHTGQPMNTRTFRPEDIYRHVANVPPDLLIYFDDLNWRSIGAIGKRQIYSFENDTGPDDANHSQYGIWILYDPARPGHGRVEDISIYDVAPTLLARMGLPISPAMRGVPRAL